MVSVATGGSTSDFTSFLDQYGLHTPLTVTGGRLFSRFNISSTPSSVVVDKNGNVLDTYSGYFPQDKILAFT